MSNNTSLESPKNTDLMIILPLAGIVSVLAIIATTVMS